MNKSGNILFVLHFIGVVTLAYLCYLGSSYRSQDNPFSFVYSVLIAVAIFFIFVGLVWLLSESKNRPVNQGFTLGEGVCLVVYVFLGYFAYGLTSHAINVQFLCKEQIRETALDKIDEIGLMNARYVAKVDTTCSLVKGELRNERNRYLNNRQYDLAKSLERFCTVPANVMSESDLSKHISNIREGKVNDTLSNEGIIDLKRILINWDKPKLSSCLREIDEKLKANLEHLKQVFPMKDNACTNWNQHKFDFKISPPVENLVSDPEKLTQKYNPSSMPSLGVTLMLHLFILSLYFFTGRNGTRRFYPRRGELKNIGIDM